MVTGNNGGRPNTVRIRQSSHRDNPVNCQGLPTLRVGNRQERKRSYGNDTAPITRYSKMTAGQISKAIQDADVSTLNGNAEHKKLEGYKDCYLANSIHGNGICLKARQTLTMGKNDGPCNRWKYQGDVQQIVRGERVGNIPLPHLIYGCEFEAKGKRFRVVPREPMDNLIKFIDGSEPGEPPHVMLAVDQND